VDDDDDDDDDDDEDEDDYDVAIIVERAVQTLYKRLEGGVTGTSATSAKKVPVTAGGHRVRDDYDDTAALAFLTAAVVDVVVGGEPMDETTSSPVPANNSSGPSDNGESVFRSRNVIIIFMTGGFIFLRT